MSRPDAPTPRTDAAWDEEWRMKAADPNSDPAHGMCDFAMQLERELALAQTEIKGHVRMGEELKAELAAHKIVIGLLFESLPECPFMGDLPGYVDEMKARIAELEKVLRLYQRGRHGWEEEGMLAGEWLKIQAQFDAAVTEALKDRA